MSELGRRLVAKGSWAEAKYEQKNANGEDIANALYVLFRYYSVRVALLSAFFGFVGGFVFPIGATEGSNPGIGSVVSMVLLLGGIAIAAVWLFVVLLAEGL